MGANCRLALRCITSQAVCPVPSRVCLDVCVVLHVGIGKLGHCQFMPPYSRRPMHTLCSVLFTSSALLIPLLLQHLSLPRSLSPRITSQSLLLVSLSVPPQSHVTGLNPPTAATLSFTCHGFVAVWMLD